MSSSYMCTPHLKGGKIDFSVMLLVWNKGCLLSFCCLVYLLKFLNLINILFTGILFLTPFPF